MNPAQRLPAFPSDPTIVHELGHVLVGLEIGAQEQGIEFPTIVHDELARAWWGEGQAISWQRMVRGLAGMYFQALLEPQSLDQEFVTRLMTGRLFDVAEPGALNACMAGQGLNGDWQRVHQGARELNAEPKKWMPSIRHAHEDMRTIVSTRKLDQLALELKGVVKHWLSTDHEDAPFWAIVLHPPGPITDRWRAWP